MTRIRWYGPTILLLITVTTAMAFGPVIVRKIARSYEDQRIELVGQRLQENKTLVSLSDAFKDIATFVKPSVTSISILARDPSTNRLLEIGNGSGWVYRYYPDPENPNQYADVIMTNHHVVEDYLIGRAEQVVVRFDDGGEYRATDIRTDPKTDVAVLRIDRDDLRPAVIASEPATQGELAFAFGSPFHFEFSMSQGIVSATGRQLQPRMFDNYENYIQTDAAINPGNSGGPLTNVRGEVIGMNTAIATTRENSAGAFSGLGFAIPVDLAVRIADQLLDNGEVSRGYLGVYINDVEFVTAQELGFQGGGVLIEPAPASPAQDAGLRLGDIITHVNDRKVNNTEQLRSEVSSYEPGEDVTVKVWRSGETFDRTVTLGTEPNRSVQRGPGLFDDAPSDLANSPLTRMGFDRLQTYTPSLAASENWAYTPGVLVRLIERRSQAQQNAVRPASIITAVDGTPVRNLDQLLDLMAGLRSGDRVVFTIKKWFGNSNRFETNEIEFRVP